MGKQYGLQVAHRVWELVPRAAGAQCVSFIVLRAGLRRRCLANANRIARERCAISPSTFRPHRPGEVTILDDATVSTGTGTSQVQDPDKMGRMIDWSIALQLDFDSDDVLSEAYKKLFDYEHSLNQSMSYIRNKPLCVDIEVKKSSTARDPEVQLAIWASAALLKKRHHNWDTSMPMPAIAVDGFNWTYFLFFELNKDLVCHPSWWGTSTLLTSLPHIGYDGANDAWIYAYSERRLGDLIPPASSGAMVIEGVQGVVWYPYHKMGEGSCTSLYGGMRGGVWPRIVRYLPGLKRAC